MIGALQRWLANRLLPATVPQASRRDRWALWARQHADQRGVAQAQSRRDEYVKAHEYRRLEATYDRLLMAQLGSGKERQTIPYPTMNQLGYAKWQGMRALPKPMPINLRRFSETPPYHKAVSKIQSIILPLELKCQPKAKRKLVARGDKPPAEMQRRIDIVNRMLEKPNDDDSTNLFFAQLIEELLINGAGPIEKQPTRDKQRPYRLWPVDALSVRVNWSWTSDDDEDPDRSIRYVQGFPYGSGSTSITDGLDVLLHNREMMYLRMRPRTHTPYGFGAGEAAFNAINALLGHLDARERNESNETPPYGISLGPKSNDLDAEATRSWWINEIEGSGVIPIWAGGDSPSVLQFRQRQLSGLNEWPEILLRLIGISFGLSPQSMGVERDVNRSTADVAQSEEFMTAALPLIGCIEDGFTYGFLDDALGWDDLELKFVVTIGDKLKQAQMLEILTGADILQLDEAREEIGRDDLPNGDGKQSQTQHRAANSGGFGQDPMGRAALEQGGAPGKGAGGVGGQGVAEVGARRMTEQAVEVARAALLKEIAAGRKDHEDVTVEISDPVMAAALQQILQSGAV